MFTRYSCAQHHPLIYRDVSGVGRRYYAVGETYVEYGESRKVVA
jgi:hypothetical protein